ncbi:MAG TPA: imidazole glycerol phosphate synthase subunit HisH [Ktedonobacteraceae bacterium]|nr:imidazole glycerol phosphate synthase subunit HisH [Ktedonobacteraceae bacterium]
MIAIIDYGAGNILSIARALEAVGAKVQVTDEADVVRNSGAVVLPGVGSGGAAMARMCQQKLDDAIRQATEEHKPFLGICLGMQLLADHHDEGEVGGLQLFSGTVRKIPAGPKVPHMGWNQIQPTRTDLPIFANIPADAYFYFAHSYYVEPQDQQGVAALTEYGALFCSVIATERVWGTQFHPEKSGEPGLQLLRNFVKWVQS